MLYLSAQDVARCLPMPEATDAMARALTLISAGKVRAPVRSTLDMGDDSLLLMPARVDDDAGPSLAVKLVSVFPGNAAHGLPVIDALVAVYDAGTGRPRALLDGASLTAIRTAAASAAATRALASRSADTVAILGAGVQARAHAQALATTRRLRRITIWARRPQAARTLAEELDAELPCAVHAVEDADEAVAGARIVCTVTPADQPLFSADAIAPGTHINAVGAYTPTMQEIPDDTVAAARVFVDCREAALAEAGDLLGPMSRGVITADHIAGEVGEVIAGRCEGRRAADDVTLFKSVGHAAEDAVAAAAAVERALALGAGQRLGPAR